MLLKIVFDKESKSYPGSKHSSTTKLISRDDAKVVVEESHKYPEDGNCPAGVHVCKRVLKAKYIPYIDDEEMFIKEFYFGQYSGYESFFTDEAEEYLEEKGRYFKK